MNLVDINTLFPTDEKCRELLTRLRWPAGPECPRCKMPAVELETEKTLYYCKECDYQFTVTAGTIFNDSHLPLNKWFLATLLLCEAKKGMSACQIKRTLGVSYKTAWYLCHRIRAAMKEVGPMLDGTVEMDETYVGGKLRGAGKDWRGLHRTYKETVIGIRKRNGDLRFFHAEDAKTGTLAKYIQENISEDVDVVITGELPAYPRALGKLRKRHETVNHWHKEYVRRGTDIHTNTVESAFSLLKRGIVGSWHKVSAKHLSAYLDEMTFRFNRRKNHNLFLDTLRHMITAPVLTFERLTA
ncbi:MAG: IS1595 family transposase [Candidatus Acidiferrales bacterium]